MTERALAITHSPMPCYAARRPRPAGQEPPALDALEQVVAAGWSHPHFLGRDRTGPGSEPRTRFRAALDPAFVVRRFRGFRRPCAPSSGGLARPTVDGRRSWRGSIEVVVLVATWLPFYEASLASPGGRVVESWYRAAHRNWDAQGLMWTCAAQSGPGQTSMVEADRASRPFRSRDRGRRSPTPPLLRTLL